MNDTVRPPIATRSTPPLGGGALRAYRRLLGYLRPYRGRFIIGILGGMLFSATMASFALLAKKFGDDTFTHQDPRTIVWVPLALIGLFILRGLGDFTQTYFMGYVGRRIVSQLRREVFRASKIMVERALSNRRIVTKLGMRVISPGTMVVASTSM